MAKAKPVCLEQSTFIYLRVLPHSEYAADQGKLNANTCEKGSPNMSEVREGKWPTIG